MRKMSVSLVFLGLLLFACPLQAQQVCPGLPYVANTPEDALMQAVNGAEKPEEQIAALDKFAQEHATSKFMPCVYEYYTITYLKLNNYDKVVEYGEKGLASNYKDVMLMLNLLKAYVGSGKVTDAAFDVINQAPDVIKAESKPAKPPTVSDAEWQKALEEDAALAKDELAYVVYAFLQLVPREADPNKRIEQLDRFAKTFPDDAAKNAAQINYVYFIAYKMANKPDKAVEYGEKTIVADPNNLVAYNLLGYDYALGRTNPEKGAEYAKKAIGLAQQMKKPEGLSDAQFKQEQDNQLGMAHLSLGYVAFTRAVTSKTKKMLQPAIDELKVAADLLGANPELQGQALYYLAYAYESGYPANHRGAAEALNRAVLLQSSWRTQANDLLSKVKKASSKASEEQ
ncbi:MAG: tetratricopeptide repeat protein [Terriglobia bacterium]